MDIISKMHFFEKEKILGNLLQIKKADLTYLPTSYLLTCTLTMLSELDTTKQFWQ